MSDSPHGFPDDGLDTAPEFVYAVSLLAALEGATGKDGHADALPFLGMARAELVDFGQRRLAHFVDVQVNDFHAGLLELDQRLTAIRTTSKVLQHTLRADSAQRLLRRAIAADG